MEIYPHFVCGHNAQADSGMWAFVGQALLPVRRNRGNTRGDRQECLSYQNRDRRRTECYSLFIWDWIFRVYGA